MFRRIMAISRVSRCGNLYKYLFYINIEFRDLDVVPQSSGNALTRPAETAMEAVCPSSGKCFIFVPVADLRIATV